MRDEKPGNDGNGGVRLESDAAARRFEIDRAGGKEIVLRIANLVVVEIEEVLAGVVAVVRRNCRGGIFVVVAERLRQSKYVSPLSNEPLPFASIKDSSPMALAKPM